MINFFSKNFFILLFLIILIIFPKNEQNANEILIYADDISYDKDENIIAKGKAKIIYENRILTSDLIIFSKINNDIILPLEFTLKDERDNYYYGSSGKFNNKLGNGSINNVRVLLKDGSRIVGKNAKRQENSDVITKAVYSPCKSRIKIANFLCPIWQLEGEKCYMITIIYFFIKNMLK